MARHSTFTKPVVEPIADGQYPAIIYQLIDLGSQKFSKDGREWYSPQRLIGFEIPGLTYENKDGESISKVISITAFDSLNPTKNGQIGQREVIDAVAGSANWDEDAVMDYDLDKLIGAQVMLTIAGAESKGKVYQNIIAIESMPKDMPLTPIREKVSVTIDDFVSLESLDLPEWIKNKIAASKEYQDHKNFVAIRDEGEVSQVQMSGEVSSFESDPALRDEIKLEDVPF